jgi:hypothetical protein
MKRTTIEGIISVIFVFALLFFSSQCNAQTDSPWKTINSGNDSAWKILGGTSVSGTHPYSIFDYKPVQNIWISWDTCTLEYFRSQKEMEDIKKASWRAWANADTVRFIVPPKHMIIGNNSYTSMFLNGTWYFLMDPTNLK